jgi:SAM-dependent methyltransferase
MSCACGARYPIVDGVPILTSVDPLLALERDVEPDVAALLAAGLSDDAPYARLLEHVSIYMDACWGDRATPAVDFGARAIVDKLAALPRVARAVELGAGVGRAVAELARTAERVVAIELHVGALRRARRLLAGDTIAYARRASGRHYERATARGIAAPNATLACGDALDPPLAPGMYDRVVALNVLDSVARPRQLLSVMDALCAADGEVIVASPYAWQSAIVDEPLGGADPAATVRAIFESGDALRARYRVLDEADLAWTLRRDTRAQSLYRVHYLRMRKLGAGAAV